MKINYFNAEHTHALIDLPTNKCVEEVIKLFKGGSSYWINDNKLVRGKFAWGRGYGAFSVSHSDVERVARYIAKQEEHHRKKSYAEEYEALRKAVRSRVARRRKPLKRFDDHKSARLTRLKPGENEKRTATRLETGGNEGPTSESARSQVSERASDTSSLLKRDVATNYRQSHPPPLVKRNEICSLPFLDGATVIIKPQ